MQALCLQGCVVGGVCRQGPSGTRGMRYHFDLLLFYCCLEEVGKYTKCREMQGKGKDTRWEMLGAPRIRF